MARKELTLAEAMFANHLGWSDVNPYEIVRKITDKKIEIRAMKAVSTKEGNERLGKSFQPGGFVGHYDNYAQEWTITSQPDYPTEFIRLHKDGEWYGLGHRRFCLALTPYKFYDYNF